MDNIITVGGEVNASINFAMQQNYVPVIRYLIVNNTSEETIENLDLKVTFEPEFAREYIYHIDNIPANESIEISPVKLTTNTEFLFSLTEKMIGIVTVSVLKDENVIFSDKHNIELLAYDEWSGLLIMPEIITAFITPNHPAVTAVIREASEFLKKWKGTPSFTGYQTNNPNNVKLQMAAIYAAAAQKKIVYNNPPASYEVIGQRVRLPHTVLEQKMGTCLDLSVLYAACLEAVGLFPLLFFIKGHAFCGCHLEKETFADCVVDDVSAIEKRIVTGAEELLLVECTDFVDGGELDFDRALKHGKDHLLNISDFICAIDIQRTRGSGIRPIPLRIESSFSGAQLADENEKAKEVSAPKELDSSLLGRVAEGSGEPVTKIKIWERKLLDFSLRNSLLNFRVTKSTLQIMVSDLGELEDRLADGKDFRIMEIPSEWTFSVRDAKMFEIENERDLITNIAAEEFKSSRIRTFLGEKELDLALKNLYRSAKVSMEENGSNTLFLALGLLRWFESDLSEKPRFAPIVLIPIDIVRNARNKGYVIRSRQEEPQINITLLEYLRQDHGVNITGLDPLPLDEHGIDLPLVFNTVRQAVMGKARWNVEEYAFIGLFSFSRFVMWSDLRSRSEEIKQNKVVSSLIEGAMTWTPEEINITSENIDTEFDTANTAVPMSADSSQLAAIAAAGMGQSFVLHGPPGTGKSQTITNMIANALYNGKTVLFAAEKMAALNVVQKRLESIGLGPFCLELHSNKTNKSAVLGKLNGTLEVGRIKFPEEYAAEAERLNKQKSKLNGIIAALHKKQKAGISPYEAISEFERNFSEYGKITFDKNTLADLTKEDVSARNELIGQYRTAISETGIFSDFPLNDIGISSYSMELRDEFKKSSEELAQKTVSCKGFAEELKNAFGYGGAMDRAAVIMLKEIETALQADGDLLPELLASTHYDAVLKRIYELLETGREYSRLRAQTEEKFESSVFEYSAEDAKMRRRQAESTWFLPKAMGLSKLVKELKPYAKTPSEITKASLADIHETLCTVAEKKKTIRDFPADIAAMFTGIFANENTDWKSLEASVKKTEAVMSAVRKKGIPAAEIAEKLKNVSSSPILANACRELSKFFASLEAFENKFAVDTSPVNNSPEWFDDTAKAFERRAAHSDRLKDAAAFKKADTELRENGLICVSESYQSGKITAGNIESAYSCGLNYGFALLMIDNDERLKDFSGKNYDELIERFKETIDRFSLLTVQELSARLSSKIPASGTASAATSEMGILKRAIKSNGRMMSLRSLFDKIPTLLRKLCPCMLMSPISVAQYIDPSFPKFDLVIFDEASQLPTSEAVGTIARGENVIIVGDPKQLPPTSFFTSNRIDEENCDKEDLESLLDDCLAISMPQQYLKWHYRSRHESLITYSNMKYYDNKLLTFPSANDLVSEVKIVHPEGFYDKGKSKQNKAEAKAVVNEIIRRLSDETLRKSSIGVVTFSSVQQNLIDDMLCEEWAKHPDLEDFDRKSDEPVFIKNLENVQGDERDIILFSVAYGPDESGKISMNFGPLNRDGGWRRLNVAISRARKSMIVYSTLRPEQIDLSRTRSEGVAGLKGFLEFAGKGKLPVVSAAQVAETENAVPDCLPAEIADAVSAMGYKVRCNIGCSEFKVDIGIVDPQNEKEYLLGILLDGRNNSRCSNARDRFVLQPSVLSGLGWNIIRIWTLDWLDDKERVLRNIRTAIENIPEKEEVKSYSKPLSFANIQFEKEEPSSATATAAKPYINAPVVIRGTTEAFYLPQNKSAIKKAAEEIISVEAPISRKQLMKKVLNEWSITRSGSKVESIFIDAVSSISANKTTDGDRTFYWRNDQNPDKYEGYRVDDTESGKRSMDDISSQEIINAVTEVLREQISLSETDLIRETAKKFGYSRMGGVIESSVEYAVKTGISQEKLIKAENGNIALSE